MLVKSVSALGSKFARLSLSSICAAHQCHLSVSLAPFLSSFGKLVPLKIVETRSLLSLSLKLLAEAELFISLLSASFCNATPFCVAIGQMQMLSNPFHCVLFRWWGMVFSNFFLLFCLEDETHFCNWKLLPSLARLCSLKLDKQTSRRS